MYIFFRLLVSMKSRQGNKKEVLVSSIVTACNSQPARDCVIVCPPNQEPHLLPLSSSHPYLPFVRLVHVDINKNEKERERVIESDRERENHTSFPSSCLSPSHPGGLSGCSFTYPSFSLPLRLSTTLPLFWIRLYRKEPHPRPVHIETRRLISSRIFISELCFCLSSQGR